MFYLQDFNQKYQDVCSEFFFKYILILDLNQIIIRENSDSK